MAAPFPPIRDLAAALRDGRLTAETLTERCLAVVERRDGELNAFVTVLADAARARARRADRELATGRDRGPLHGIPISVKDLIDLRDTRTTGASAALDGPAATADAPVLAALREAGVVVIGKCNLHELALGTTGEESRFGPTRNPHAPGHTPGGSSSGSAVSVAAGMSVASIGTDTGGSIRIPASACGIVGLKPTFGEVDCDGVVPLAATLDHVGPLGSSVDDVGCLLHVMTGGRPSTAPVTVTPEPAPRVGVLRGYFVEVTAPDVREPFETRLSRLRRRGWTLDDVEIGAPEVIADVYRRTVLYEAFRVHRAALETRPAAFSPGVRARLEAGAAVSEADYRDAQTQRIRLRRAVDDALAGRQGLALPTLPVPAPPLGADTVRVGGTEHGVRELTLRLTQLFDLTGHPAISLPMARTIDGRPTGFQLVGAGGDTPGLLRLASAYEHATG